MVNVIIIGKTLRDFDSCGIMDELSALSESYLSGNIIIPLQIIPTQIIQFLSPRTKKKKKKNVGCTQFEGKSINIGFCHHLCFSQAALAPFGSSMLGRELKPTTGNSILVFACHFLTLRPVFL